MIYSSFDELDRDICGLLNGSGYVVEIKEDFFKNPRNNAVKAIFGIGRLLDGRYFDEGNVILGVDNCVRVIPVDHDLAKLLEPLKTQDKF